mmetsp:Transcript_4132/g.11545  ORF Transcript_4132/g.11545 Transcript_4132/m.11545 type:complete len:200 (-) Transcript_4132:16-615(-)
MTLDIRRRVQELPRVDILPAEMPLQVQHLGRKRHEGAKGATTLHGPTRVRRSVAESVLPHRNQTHGDQAKPVEVQQCHQREAELHDIAVVVRHQPVQFVTGYLRRGVVTPVEHPVRIHRELEQDVVDNILFPPRLPSHGRRFDRLLRQVDIPFLNDNSAVRHCGGDEILDEVNQLHVDGLVVHKTTLEDRFVVAPHKEA